ncbi:peptidase M26 [Bacillus sp. PAMC26568]|nr:peptidase M26 [Bacillus sp. PAMC26568]
MLGAGTQSNPFIIQTPTDLHNVRNNLTAYYELGNDIDMASWGLWNPISFYDNVTWVNGFTGNFDGKGFKIKNLTISKNNDGIYLGLFGQFFNGVLQNVGLENVNINNGGNGNNRLVGALVGYTYNATIRNCYVTGGSIKAQDETGGLIGKAWESDIENCFASIDVTLSTSYYGGGFMGTADSNSTIRNCYSTGLVDYTQSSPWDGISGFVGFVRNNTDIFFYDCYWDTQTSSQANSPKISNPPSTVVTGVTGKTTSQMKTQSTFTVWDFTNTWSINSNYPTLRAFGVPLPPAKIETVLVSSFTNPIYSNVSKSNKVTKQTNTYTNNILSGSERDIATIRTVEGYLSPIETSIEKRSRIVRSSTQSVVSFLNPISAAVERSSRKFKSLLSHVSPLQADISVLYPLNTKAVNAYLTVLENPSRAYAVVNISNVSHIENPSLLEVME